MLSQQDVEFFRTNGYFLNREPIFAPEKFDRLVGIFEEHLDDKGDKLSDELDTPHFRDPRLLEFLLSDEVLDLVEPLVGPDIALWTSHFISKDPYVGRATPWHEERALPALRDLLDLPFEHVIVSHGDPVHGRAAFERALRLPPWGG